MVSINANRGITAGAPQDLGTPGSPFIEDRGLNLARARLVLKHLELLSRWNRGIEATPSSLGFSLRGAIDFREVALVGHSRGGEGVRAAYNIYTGRNTDINPYASIDWRSRIADTVDFKGIFEIAPVDRQTVRTLNAEGTTWSVMLTRLTQTRRVVRFAWHTSPRRPRRPGSTACPTAVSIRRSIVAST